MNFNNVNVNVSGPVQPASTYKTKVLKGNHSFASQVTEPNMKYVIKHDFDLDGGAFDIDFSNADTHTVAEVTYYYIPFTAYGSKYTLIDDTLVFIDAEWNGLSAREIKPEKGTLFMIASITGGLHKNGYSLNIVTVPKNCILEFDGGSLDNGVIVGQDTLFINVGDVDIWGDNLTRLGTWREKQGGEGGIPDKEYDPEHHSGLGRKTLQLNGDNNVLYQTDFNSDNTVYVIPYDFTTIGSSDSYQKNLTERVVIGDRRYYYNPSVQHIGVSELYRKVLLVGELINREKNAAYPRGTVFRSAEDVYFAKSEAIPSPSIKQRKSFEANKTGEVTINNVVYNVTDVIDVPSGFTLTIPDGYVVINSNGTSVIETNTSYTNTGSSSVNVIIGNDESDFTEVSCNIESPFVDYVLEQETSIGGNTYFCDMDAAAFNVRAGYTLKLSTSYVLLNSSGTSIVFTPSTQNPEFTPSSSTAVRIGKLASTYENVAYTISECIVIPENCMLDFDGGSISNGVLVGTDTAIIAPKTVIFTNIVIEGAWNVPDITSAWFSDAESNNSLKNVFALQDANVYNRIVVEGGSYLVSANSEEDTVLPLKSNLDLVINGTVTLQPNSFKACYILGIYDEKNINISGSGTLIGDKTTHTGTEGQWGHGIYVAGSFITIKDFTIKDCWGDCICIGKSKSQLVEIKNVIVDNCFLDNGRRQGISVTHGSNVVIKNCRITNVGGQNPQAGIDIEPNDGDETHDSNYTRNIVVENCRIENCTIGIVIYGRNNYEKSCISVNNCYIQCLRRAISVNGANTTISVTNCEMHTRFHAIEANTVDGSKDNVILFENNILTQIPEDGDDMSTDTRGCAIYALKGDYKFHHNSIICTLPAFRFASGNKYIEDNDIECDMLFYPRQFNNVRIKGNRIKGNVTIPGEKTVFENNYVDGLLKSTQSYTIEGQTIKISDKRSIIRGNFITNVADGNEIVTFRGRIVLEDNKFTNISLVMSEGVVANNEFTYSASFVLTGILLNLNQTDFVNNTVDYKGTNAEDANIYMVRSGKSIVGNDMSSTSRIQYVFYASDGCFISGNKVTLPEGHPVNRIVPEGSPEGTFKGSITVIPTTRTYGTLEEVPAFPVGERYYRGCRYFATDLQKQLTWNGYVWVDNDNEPIGYKSKNAVSNFTIGKRINTRNYDIGDEININPRDDADYDCNILEVHAGDLVVLTGSGGYNPTSYALIDSNNVLLGKSAHVPNGYVYDYPPTLTVPITVDCRIIFNFKNGNNTPPYNNRMEIPYNAVIYSNYIEQQDSESN